jgi:GTP cyclohydrolase III
MQSISLGEKSIVIQTKFGTAVVERIAEGFFVAKIDQVSSTGRTPNEAASAASRVAQNLMLIERQNF